MKAPRPGGSSADGVCIYWSYGGGVAASTVVASEQSCSTVVGIDCSCEEVVASTDLLAPPQRCLLPPAAFFSASCFSRSRLIASCTCTRSRSCRCRSSFSLSLLSRFASFSTCFLLASASCDVLCASNSLHPCV